MLRDRVMALTGWRRHVAAFASGSFSVLAMAPFFVWPVLFLSLPVLVWLVDGSLRREGRRRVAAAALVGWWWGFGYFLFGMFWIGEAFLVEAEVFAWLLPFAVTLLPAGLALFPAAAVAAAGALWAPGLNRVLALAITLAVAEYLRGHVLTGLPWNVLGYALTSPLVLMQGAGLVGVYGLSLLAVVIFASPMVALADAGDARRRGAGVGIAVGLLGLLALYGAVRLAGPPSGEVAGVKLRIVQPSVPQRDKWRREKQGEIFRDHLELSRRDAAGRIDDLAGITHVVWPEAAMPFLPLQTPEALAAIGELLRDKTQLITGALRVEAPDAAPLGAAASGRRRIFNSLMVFGEGGRLTALYDKIHLVPFGEYLPLQGVLEAIGLQQLTRIRGGFDVGPTPRPLLAVAGLPPVLGLVCYEAIFPAAVVQGRERPGVIVNVTNDGWFGNTTGPRQHLHQTRVRAVEEGVPIVRVANNGISALIDGHGRVLARIDLNVRASVDAALPLPVSPPIYAATGDRAFFALVVLAVVLLWWRRNLRVKVAQT